MSEVIVVGALMIDVKSVSQRIPTFGEMVIARDFKFDFGGKGANQAAMASILGARVGMIGKLGDDYLGNAYRKHFTKLGVDLSAVSVAAVRQTGITQIIASEQSGEHAIIVHFGANTELTDDDVAKAEVHIAAAKCLTASLETSLSTVLQALRIAKQHGVMTIVNSSPRRRVKQLRASANFHEYLRLIDVLCPNEPELELLSGAQLPADRDCSEFLDSVARLVVKLHDECVRAGNPQVVVLCTLGDRGVAFWDSARSCVEFIEANRVSTVDPTGAGDSFIGSLAYFLVRHEQLPFREKIRRAMQIAAITVTRHGTQCCYPHRGELSQELFA